MDFLKHCEIELAKVKDALFVRNTPSITESLLSEEDLLQQLIENLKKSRKINKVNFNY